MAAGLDLRATWLRNNAEEGKKADVVNVVLIGFGQASNSDGSGIRPVAIVADAKTGQLRYVECKFIRVEVGQ